jgi:hypothetical protein
MGSPRVGVEFLEPNEYCGGIRGLLDESHLREVKCSAWWKNFGGTKRNARDGDS